MTQNLEPKAMIGRLKVKTETTPTAHRRCDLRSIKNIFMEAVGGTFTTQLIL